MRLASRLVVRDGPSNSRIREQAGKAAGSKAGSTGGGLRAGCTATHQRCSQRFSFSHKGYVLNEVSIHLSRVENFLNILKHTSNIIKELYMFFKTYRKFKHVHSDYVKSYNDV